MKKLLLGLGALVVVGLLYFGVSNSSSAPVPAAPATVEDSSETLGGGSGGNVTQQQDIYTNGVGLGNEYVTFTRSGTIGRGQNQGRWTNSTGRKVYVELASLATSGVASSSYKFYVGTSTATSIASDFTAPYASIINGVNLATSTVATTTTNFDPGVGLGPEVIGVPTGQTVFIQMQAKDSVACGASGACETATSTNRGFNLDWYLRMYYKP